MDALGELVPAGERAHPILDKGRPLDEPPEVEKVARRRRQILDPLARRISVLRRIVWPLRLVGAVARVCPPVGDRVVVAMQRQRAQETAGRADHAGSANTLIW